MAWSEKYRPRRLEDVIGQDAVRDALLGAAKRGPPLPHLLFAGPPGTGKTSAAHALAASLYGEAKPLMVRELNGSDDRGIDAIRHRVLPFLRTKGLGEGWGQKLLILDEGDALTSDAWDALKRPLEQYAANAAVVVTANDATRIPPPILSRLSTPGVPPGKQANFTPLTPGAVADVLRRVAVAEGVPIPGNVAPIVLGELATQAGGDVRKAIGLLESVSMDGQLQRMVAKYAL